MTNASMVKPERIADEKEQDPGHPPGMRSGTRMPADEDGARPATDAEPIDSPQLNARGDRPPPKPGEIGLATEG